VTESANTRCLLGWEFMSTLWSGTTEGWRRWPGELCATSQSHKISDTRTDKLL